MESYYSISAVFQVDYVPFPTIDLSYKVINNVGKHFEGDTFTLVFYQVEIDQIWENPTLDAEY